MRVACLFLTLMSCADTVDDRPAELPYLVDAILRPGCGTAACHSSLSQAGGLAFDTLEATRDAIAQERNLVVAGDPELSKLVRVLVGDAVRMPPDAPLPDADVALIRAWIEAGAMGATP